MIFTSNPNQWRSLDDDGQITYLVGLVARGSAELDGSTRMVYATLKGNDPRLGWKAPIPMTQRVEQMLESIEVAPELEDSDRELARAAVEGVLSAFQERNRYVHDSLMPSGEEQAAWFMNRLDLRKGETVPTSGRTSVAELLECRKALSRGSWQMWALHKLILVNRAGKGDAEAPRWRAMLRGDFHLHDDDTISYSH